jgi:hypothetical protein
VLRVVRGLREHGYAPSGIWWRRCAGLSQSQGQRAPRRKESLPGDLKNEDIMADVADDLLLHRATARETLAGVVRILG